MNFFRILSAGLCLMGAIATNAHAEDIDFNNSALAVSKWLGLKKQNDLQALTMGSPFEYGATLVWRQLLAKPDYEWKVAKVINYPYYGAPATFKSVTQVQTGQAPLELNHLVTGAWYFISKNEKERLVLTLAGSQMVVYYNKESKENFALAKKFQEQFMEEHNKRIVYLGKVLEFKETGQVGFFGGVDHFKFTWDSFIYDPEKKPAIIDTFDSFLNNYNQETWSKNGLPMNRGVLLYGPPGTGKSFVARVLVSNILTKKYKNKVTYIHVQARHVTSVYSVRTIYQIARMTSPTVVFFEDIDLIAGTNRNDRPDIKNELMQQLSGLETLEGVLTVGTTNYGERIDPALQRSKRLGFHFEIGLPSFVEIQDLYKLYLSKAKLDGVNTLELAQNSVGFSGADIKEIVDLAVEDAVRKGSVSESKDQVILKPENINFAINTKKHFKVK